MRKNKIRILCVVICSILFCFSANAANVMNDGYYLAKVYIQNYAGGYIGAAVTTAAGNWNNSSISPRSIIINSTSSSGVYADDFTDPNLQEFHLSAGLYLPLSQSSTCNCHKTTIFNIFINEDVVSENVVVSVVAHELGHAFGLDEDQSSDDRLMSYGRNRILVTSPIQDEVDSMLSHWNTNHN